MRANYEIVKAAAKFREKNGFGLTEPIRIKSLLLKLEILTIFRRLNLNFSGMAVKADNMRFMLVNSNHSIGRQHFTILHEIYHLFVQKDFNSLVCQTGVFDKKNKNEYAADIFAANVLMPDQGILARIPDNELRKNKISLSTILEIEQYYSCSRTALLVKLINLGLIDLEKYEHLKENVIKTAKLYGYDSSLYTHGNHELVIGDYGSKAKNLYDHEIISESHFASLMHDIVIDIDSEEHDVNDAEFGGR